MLQVCGDHPQYCKLTQGQSGPWWSHQYCKITPGRFRPLMVTHGTAGPPQGNPGPWWSQAVLQTHPRVIWAMHKLQLRDLSRDTLLTSPSKGIVKVMGWVRNYVCLPPSLGTAPLLHLLRTPHRDPQVGKNSLGHSLTIPGVACGGKVQDTLCSSETIMFLHQIFYQGLKARVSSWPTLVLGECGAQPHDKGGRVPPCITPREQRRPILPAFFLPSWA